MKRRLIILLCIILFFWQAFNSGQKYFGGRRTVAINFVYEEKQDFPSVSICPAAEKIPEGKYNFSHLQALSFENLNVVFEAYQFYEEKGT